MNSKFNTLAMAITAVYGPVQGFTAFLAFAMATELFKFLLIEVEEYGGEKRTYWFKDIGDANLLENEYGGRYFRKATDKVLAHVSATSFDTLDWKRTSYYIEDGESGWLDPDGNFWGCYYGGHASLAKHVLKMGYAEIERAGWVHVDEAGKIGRYTWRKASKGGEPTEAQAKWLEAHGHDLDPGGVRARKKAEMLRLGEFEIDKKADRAAFERMMAKAGIKINRPTDLED